MKNIGDIHVDLDVVLSKNCTLKQILSPYELAMLKSKAEKNNYSEDAILEAAYRLIRQNITEYLDDSDFMDASLILETDPYIVKAMELMQASQRDAGVLLVEKEYKYPGCWVNDIAEALRGLECPDYQYEHLVWAAYYIQDFQKNKEIPGWEHLQDVLENYYDTL